MKGVNRAQTRAEANSNFTYTKSDYMFQLRNVSPKAHSAFNVQVHFGLFQDGHKIYTSTPCPRALKNQLLNVFYLQMDFPDQPAKIFQQAITFSNLKQEAIGTSQAIFLPRPKFNYCTTCRKNFDDYNQHIYSKQHHKKISINRFTGYINDLVHKFNPIPKPKQRQKEKKYLKK